MANAQQKWEVRPEQLRWRCDPNVFGVESSDELKPLDQIIGQDRALKAIKLGLEVKSAGYNIFVAGMTGTGRKTTIKHFLDQIEIDGEIPGDICYVNNFQNEDLPIVLYFPPGQGRQFAKDLERTIDYIKKLLSTLFESEAFQKRAKQMLESYNEQTRQLFGELEKKINQAGFAIVRVDAGPVSHPEIFPKIDDRVVQWEEVMQMVQQGRLSKEDFEKLQHTYQELSAQLQDTLRQVRRINEQATEAMEKLEIDSVRPTIHEIFADLKQKYPIEKVHGYLDDVREDILKHLDQFKTKSEAPAATPVPVPAKPDPFLKYRVNVLVDNSGLKKIPVVIENSPSYKNLFGTIERVVDVTGVWRTDFTRIKAGSLVRANGGFLVLNLIDTLIEPGVWTALKRTLKNNQVDIQAYDPFYMVSTSAMKPEPITVKVKVLIIGDADLFYRLYYYDEDFPKIFKIRADFDTEMELQPEALLNYGRFVRKICGEEGLLPFDREAMAAVAEYGVELTEDQSKISTQFSLIADMIREASFWARQDGAGQVTRAHVARAIEEKIYRSRLIEDKMKEMIRDGHIIIETDGQRVGQVNGLSVYQIGEYSFGLPSRITAQVGIGQSGIISIEREADLSGKTHTKGVAIIAGYFRGQYASHTPLNMSVSITFEQNYGYVEGDSASSTEIYAILSALSELPLRQDIAVTGSVDQWGHIQPIGGVNEKIHGFFDVCKIKGFTGRQGVIIPRKNLKNLMLRPEVVEAVEKGEFHIYAIDTIDEGIEILTGVKAGVRNKKGNFPRNSVHWCVERRLKELDEGKRKPGAPKKKSKNEKAAKKKEKEEAEAEAQRRR